MPVTIIVAEHKANAINTSTRNWQKTTNQQDLLPSREKGKSKSIIQSSVLPNEYSEKYIASFDNGLVWAAYHAYSDHHHLTLRPEDIWFAIISQLSFYINAHSEELRSMFVTHEGRKELVIHAEGSIYSVDFAMIAKAIVEMIQENVKRLDLQTWIMPDFTTTTDSDRAVALVLFMGAMQKYFSYGACLTCGIPSVTLLGERVDWEKILQRLDVLPEFGEEPAVFANLLRPVIQGLIATFDGRTPATVDFWGKIAHRIFHGSGPTYLSGWITAFCFWDADGKPILQGGDYKVDFKDIPNGYATVPFTVNDNGKKVLLTMVAGSFGVEAFDNSGSSTQDSNVVLDSVKPLTGWMMYQTGNFMDGHINNLQPLASNGANRVNRNLGIFGR